MTRRWWWPFGREAPNSAPMPVVTRMVPIAESGDTPLRSPRDLMGPAPPTTRRSTRTPREYPKVLYHLKKPSVTVTSAAEEAKLGAGWSETHPSRGDLA